MIAYLILALSALGCGALFPAPAGDSRGCIGFRFMAGISAVMLILYFGNVVARLPLGTTAFAVLVIAGTGLVRLWPEFRDRPFSRACLLHPVPILLMVVGMVMLSRGKVEYLPWQWEEYSRWFYFAKLAFLSEEYWTESFHKSYQGYPPGWTILMAYPSLVLGRFSEADMATLPFIVHVGYLGILYDISRRALERIETISFGGRIAVAWLVVLILLLVKASWKLVPTLLGSENPLSFLVGACFAGALYCMIEVRGRTMMMAFIGMFAAAAVLIKMAALALVPSLIFFAAFTILFDQGDVAAPPRRNHLRPALTGTNIKLAGLLLLPLLVVYGSWLVIDSPRSCIGAPTRLLHVDLAAVFFSDAGLYLAGRYSSAILAFLVQFKLPLTILGAVGVAVGLFHRRMMVVSFMLILFIVTSVSALYVFHLACFSEFNIRTVNSVLLSSGVWLQQLHVFGPLMLFLAALARIGRVRGRSWNLWKKRGAVHVATGLAIFLLAWQAIQATRSFASMAKQYRVGYAYRAHDHGVVKWVPWEAAAFKSALKERGLTDARVLMISQGTTEFPSMVANYHAAATARGEPIYAYRLSPGFSWGETQVNRFMRKTTRQRMLTMLRRHRVIWPFILDAWMKGVLAEIIAGRACRENPEHYFLLRRGKEGTPYICVAKWPEKTPTV